MTEWLFADRSDLLFFAKTEVSFWSRVNLWCQKCPFPIGNISGVVQEFFGVSLKVFLPGGWGESLGLGFSLSEFQESRLGNF